MSIMSLRKLLSFNGILGMTIPKEYTNALGFKRGDHAEVYLKDDETIIIKKHNYKPNKIKVDD